MDTVSRTVKLGWLGSNPRTRFSSIHFANITLTRRPLIDQEWVGGGEEIEPNGQEQGERSRFSSSSATGLYF